MKFTTVFNAPAPWWIDEKTNRLLAASPGLVFASGTCSTYSRYLKTLLSVGSRPQRHVTLMLDKAQNGNICRIDDKRTVFRIGCVTLFAGVLVGQYYY